MLVLPSGRLLEYYKNSVPQKAGLSEEMLKWMRQEANRIGIDEFGRCGGIVLDEMSIQVTALTNKQSLTPLHIYFLACNYYIIIFIGTYCFFLVFY
jgi:roadblock/LC7 domain-containing protein